MIRRPAAALALAAVGVSIARADLPAGWSVYTFTGRIHEIEPAGGVLACATDGGLLLFDPQSQVFAPAIADAGCSNGECLSSNHLTSVSRDANGNYWLGTLESGVVVFRPAASGRRYGRFFTLNTASGGNLLSDSVSCVEAWRAQAVYVGTNRGVGQIDIEGAVESYNEDAARLLGSDLRGSRVSDLAVDSLFVWVATDSGMSRYDRQPPYTVEFLPDSLRGAGAFTVENFSGTIYAGTTKGVFKWNEPAHRWRKVANFSPTVCTLPDSFSALTIARLPDTRLYVGSERTVYFYNRFCWGELAPAGRPLVEDRSFESIVTTGDTAWSCQQNANGEGGYLEQCVIGRTPSQWIRFEVNGIPGNNVTQVALSRTGTLWIGTQLAGVARLDASGRWCAFNGNDADVRAHMSDPEGHVSALTVDVGDRVWFTQIAQPGLSRPVDILAGDASCSHAADVWDRIDPGEHRFTGRYWRVGRDGEGNLFWLADGELGATEQGGFDVASADATQFTAMRQDTLGTGSLSVGAIAFDSETAPWERAYLGFNALGTHGLRRWIRSNQLFEPNLPGPQNFTEITLPDSLDLHQFRDLAVSPDKRAVWIAADNGVFEYDLQLQQVRSVLRTKTGARAGLLTGDTKDLQFDNFGNLWVASGKGLNRIRLDQRDASGLYPVEAFATIETIRDLNAASSVGQLYDPRRTVAPLPAPVVNSLAYDRSRDRLYVGTNGGMAVIDVNGLSRRAQLSIDQAVIYPNLVRLDDPDPARHVFHIGKVSEPVSVTIYTLEGTEVCTSTERDEGDVVWSLGTPDCLQNDGGFLAASGVYLARIRSSTGSVMRPIVVIR